VRVVCFPVFFASGFAALLYQVIWQRMLAIFSGADVYSVTIIVSAFMAGLGIGSLAGGHVADRVSERTSLALFGAAELAVAAFGILSASLYYDVLYVRMGHLDIRPGPMGAILFVSLLWPTFFMGASLPLLARALTRQIEKAASTVGALYGLNTLGAAMGALVATWWLLPRIGLDGSLAVGATLNAACAVVVLPFAFLGIARPGQQSPAANAVQPATAATVVPEKGAGRLTFWIWAAMYGFSGLLALSLEIVWFRMLGVMMKSTAFTFGTLLALYLSGLGLGSVAGSAVASRIRRPAAAFLMLQAAVGLCAGGLLALFIAFVDDTPSLKEYFAGYEPLSVQDGIGSLRARVAGFFGGGPTPEQSPSNFIRLYVGVPAVLVMPATFLMGCSFPLLQRVVQTDLALLGRRVGLLLLANILGSMVGTVLTGWVLLNVLGTPGTFRLLVAMSSVFALLAASLVFTRHSTPGSRRVPALAAAFGAVAILFVPVVVWMPGAGTFWSRLHGATVEQIFHGEDGSGLSVIKTNQAGLQVTSVVFVNGLGQSTLPYGDVHTALGAVPAFIHPLPRDAVIIGLGSGATVHGVAGRPDIERITCIEIIRPQLDTLEQLNRRWPHGGLRSLLEHPRIEHVFGDGRIHLMRGGRKYDIIEADALRPGSAYSGNLYSEEYFRLVRAQLKPKGLAATWAPTARVRNTFVRVFPFVMSIPGIILVGSETPIELDRRAIAARLADPRVRLYYDTAGINIERLLNGFLATPVWYTPDFNRDALTDFNTDLFPKDEYDLASGRR
jgi:spermidine synthase